MGNLQQHSLFKTTCACLFAAALSACGGGGGSSSPSTSYASSSTAYEIPPSSSAQSSLSSASTTSSSVSSSSTATAATIGAKITAIGGTYVGKGIVKILVNSAGALSVQEKDKTDFTLYIFDKDATGISACTSEQCMTNWPPLLADTNAVASAPFTIISRTDGNKQWALRDKPLYFFAGDTKAGDLNGEGVGGIWHVAHYQPVLLNQASINALDGDYFTASGKILFGSPDGSSTTNFISELKDRDNFALYIFDIDTPNTSNCNGACLVNWPPLLAGDNDIAETPYSIITRSMGGTATAKQWAYQGKPLYFFKNDVVPADTQGKAIPNWHLARPQPTKVVNSATLASYFAAAGLIKSAIPVNGNEEVSAHPKHGFSLYTFDNDTSGVSNCTDTCLTNWPALIANDGAVATAPFSLITRASGKMQWALNGMPLYFYAGDVAAGDTKGDGLFGKWHLARTAPVAVTNNMLIAHGNLITQSGAADSLHNDFTLYTFDNDKAAPGTSVCVGNCAVIWPPLFATASAKPFGDFTLITRDAGAGVYQWAYKGMPLYFYQSDTKLGDIFGEYGTWHIARP